MGRYVLRRLLQMIPVLIGTTFLVFFMVWALPGDPLAGKCGDRPCPPSYVAVMTKRLHLDENLFAQYGHYIANLLHGDFGVTAGGQKVSEEILIAYPTTLRLTSLAILFELIIGITAGVIAAIRRRFFDKFVLGFTMVVISIPVFVIGLGLQWLIGLKLKWADATATDGSWSALILPAFVLASLSLAYVSRLTRTSLVEAFRADYVRTATAKGLTRRRVIGIHALRNSLVPVITFIGADFGTLLGGAIVTEGIFNVQGVGGLTYRAIQRQEGSMVVGIVTVLVLVFLLVNLLVDLLYAVLDPRIRYS